MDTGNTSVRSCLPCRQTDELFSTFHQESNLQYGMKRGGAAKDEDLSKGDRAEQCPCSQLGLKEIV